MDSAAVVEIHRHARRADRRLGLHALVRQMAAELATTPGATDLGSALASRLRALAPVTHVQVTEVPISSPLRAGHPVMTHDYAAYAVPTRSGRQLVLEVSFPPGARPDDWTCQLLETAASLAAITFEAERGLPHGAATLSPHHGDVGPLIGSSAVMQALRERVERVATTDFTVLIEGESGVGKELVARQIHELQPPAAGAVCRHQLRGARRDAARGGAVRHRRAHGHRRARAARQVRARRRRHAVSRRGLRPVAVGAGQAAAGDSGPRGRARRRHRHAGASTSASSRRPTAASRAWSIDAGCSAPTCSTA